MARDAAGATKGDGETLTLPKNVCIHLLVHSAVEGNVNILNPNFMADYFGLRAH